MTTVTPHPPIRIELLGPARVLRAGTPVDFGLRKGLALLACLGAEAQTRSRDHLAELLWPESAPGLGRTRLRRTLHRIGTALGMQPVLVDGEGLRLDPSMAVDVIELHEALGQAETADVRERETHLRRAESLHRGDFMQSFELPGCAEFESWRDGVRADLLARRIQSLHALIALCRREGRSGEALRLGQTLLVIDRIEEASHRLQAELLLEAGRPGAARAQIQECDRLLRQELGTGASAETLELIANVMPQLPRVETRYAASEGAHVAFQTVGSGDIDLLLVPGFVSHVEIFWQEPAVAEFLTDMAGIARLILFDRRGSGLSDRTGGPPTTSTTVSDIHAVLDAAASRRAVLFGNSEGGPSALEFTVRHPDRVAGLILFGSMARGERAPDYPYALAPDDFARWLERLVSGWGGPANLDVFAPSMAADPQMRDWWARMLRLGSSPGAVRATLEALQRCDVRDLLGSVRSPTLVMHREGDRAVPVAAGKLLAEGIPGAQWHPLPGDDHWPWIGDAREVIETIRGFLAARCKPSG